MTPPDFIERDPQVIERELLAEYEAATGRPLAPAQPERVLIRRWAYRETLVRLAIQDAASQNLVAYARRPALVELGRLLGVVPLPPAAARTTLEATLVQSSAQPRVIGAGARVRSKDGRAVFRTLDPLTILPGQLSGAATAECEAVGVVGNGYIPGDIITPMEPLPGVASWTNTTTSAGGAPEEEVERLRQRILAAPERLSVAGPAGAYRYHAMGASQLITDVAVLSSAPGVVDLYVLLATGAPGQELLDAVAAACSAERVRPLCDLVQVHPPEVVEYEIDVRLTLYSSADDEAVATEASARAAAFIAWQRTKLGRDLVPEQLGAALQTIAGVYRALVVSPTARVLSPAEWGLCTAVDVAIVGHEDG
jgi:phage-related baseplate assembly protein